MNSRAQRTSEYIAAKYAAMLKSSSSDLNLNEELKKYPDILWDVLDDGSDLTVFYRKEFAGHNNVSCSFDFYDDYIEWRTDLNLSAYENL